MPNTATLFDSFPIIRNEDEVAFRKYRTRDKILTYINELMMRELIKDLENAGFVNRGGKGSQRKFVHSKVPKSVILAGPLGADAKHYQEKAVKVAIEESKK